MYLLDTNAVSDLIYDPLGSVGQRFGLLGGTSICTSIIVSVELRYGAKKRGSLKLSRQIDDVLGKMTVMSFGPPAEHRYAELRVALEAAGSPIGRYDMLIAAHALALDCILVTDNEDEFRRVPGLTIENWLRSR